MNEPSAPRADRQPAPPRGSYLPDLCLPRSVLLLVLASAVLAFILTLARRAPGTGPRCKVAFTTNGLPRLGFTVMTSGS